MKAMRSLCTFLLVLGQLCVAAPAPPPKKPKLILAVVVDQFRYDYMLRFRADYTAGFKRILEQGAVFEDAHHIHFPTVTAIGHSTFLSGATPSLSGIVGNEWFERETGKLVTSVSDPATKLLGANGAAEGSSPRRLLVSTLGDEIKMTGQQSMVIGISIKDRAAILPVGHMADGAYWFDDPSGHWVTSSYYTAALPDWVAKVNAAKPAAAAVAGVWYPVEAKVGSAKPFCAMAAASSGGVPRCVSIEASPWGNEMIEDFAEHALAAEKLGQHTGTDILAVSFSANDYVGHAVGPDAPEVRDMAIRTDRLLGKLLDDVDRTVGLANVVVVMTADHGVAPVPEVNTARRMIGGRNSDTDLAKAMNDALVVKYGAGQWILASSGGAYLNRQLMDAKKLDEADVERTAASAARRQPHVFRVYTRVELLRNEVLEDAVTDAVRRGFYRTRSGDVMVIPEEFYIYSTSGTTHGTTFNYDTHVPVIFMGAGIKAGHYFEKIAVNDIAPTLAAIVGVEQPSGSVGRVLQEMWQ